MEKLNEIMLAYELQFFYSSHSGRTNHHNLERLLSNAFHYGECNNFDNEKDCNGIGKFFNFLCN